MTTENGPPRSARDCMAEYLKEYGAVDDPRDGQNGRARTFGEGAYPKDSRAAKAYEVALDIRKFEIELYWKRAGYFWFFVAALTASLGAVLTTASLDPDQKEVVALFISCCATMVSICWVLVNYESKRWQRNWEAQVDVLEDIVLGPLYKTVMFKSKENTGKVPWSISISQVSIRVES